MLSILDKAIALIGCALEITVALTIIRRQLWRRGFPAFFAYICYSILNVGVLLASSELASKRTYFAIFSVTQGFYTLLGLLAINEAFRKIFKIYYLRKPWFSLLVPSVIITILLLALWNWSKHTPVQAGPLTIIYISLDLTANYIRAGLFGLFGILVLFWRTPWQERPFGVIIGFGIFSVVGMAADALRSDFGIKMNLVFSYASAVAYLIACVVWLRAFQRRKDDSENRPPSNVDPREILGLLDRSTRSLRGRGTSIDADKSFASVAPNHSFRPDWPLPGYSPAISI
jgi:hypothetical protein